jgi:adiponectin receptor
MEPIFIAFFWIQGILREICWLNSWLYHTFVCHSEANASLLCTMDYIGCYLTPLGMGTNLLFIELNCHKRIQITILSLGAMVIFIAIAMSLLPKYKTEEYRPIRAILSVISIVPYISGLVIAIVIVHDGVPFYYSYLSYGFVFEIIGASFYVSMYPEKAIPCAFDNILSSHILWHFFNVGFDICMMLSSFEAYRLLVNRGSCPNQ